MPSHGPLAVPGCSERLISMLKPLASLGRRDYIYGMARIQTINAARVSRFWYRWYSPAA